MTKDIDLKLRNKDKKKVTYAKSRRNLLDNSIDIEEVPFSRKLYHEKYKNKNKQRILTQQKEYIERVKNKQKKMEEWEKSYRKAYEKAYGPLN